MKNKKEIFESTENDSLEELAPTLSSHGNREDFKVPEGYFEKLPSEILLKISQHRNASNTRKVIAIFRQPRYAVAAVLIVMLVVAAAFFFRKSVDVTQVTLTDFTLEDIMQENPDLIESIDETLLLETLASGSAEGLSNYLDSTAIINHNMTDDEIRDYLDDENLNTGILFDL
jgi:hypothetical protein